MTAHKATHQLGGHIGTEDGTIEILNKWGRTEVI